MVLMWDGFWCENESGLSEQHMHTHLRTLQNATSVAVSEDQPPQSRPEICAPLIGRTRWHAPDSLQSPSLSVHQAHACREYFDRGGMKRNNYTRTHHSRPNLCIFASVCVATCVYLSTSNRCPPCPPSKANSASTTSLWRMHIFVLVHGDLWKRCEGRICKQAYLI